MLKEVLESVLENGYYQTCVEYLKRSGMNEFTALLIVSGLMYDETTKHIKIKKTLFAINRIH